MFPDVSAAFRKFRACVSSCSDQPKVKAPIGEDTYEDPPRNRLSLVHKAGTVGLLLRGMMALKIG